MNYKELHGFTGNYGEELQRTIEYYRDLQRTNYKELQRTTGNYKDVPGMTEVKSTSY